MDTATKSVSCTVFVLFRSHNTRKLFAAGICGILGSTYTGEYEDIEKLDRLVEKLNKEKVSHACAPRILGSVSCWDALGWSKSAEELVTVLTCVCTIC